MSRINSFSSGFSFSILFSKKIISISKLLSLIIFKGLNSNAKVLFDNVLFGNFCQNLIFE